MSRRRGEDSAARAAEAASEAARVLQQRQQEVKAEKAAEPAPEEPSQSKNEPQNDPERIDKLRKNRPHDMALEEIAAKRDPKPEPEEPKAEPEKAAPAAAQEEQPAPAAEAPAVEPAAEAPKLVKQKVDGEEYEVSQDEIEAAGGERAWRVQKAAENRLAKTKEALEETRKTQAQIAEWLMRQQAPQNAEKEQTDDQFIAERVDKIRFGTPEESAAALREVMQRSTRPAVDPNALTNQIVERIRNEQAVAGFKREFADVMANPLLERLARTLDAERIPTAIKSAKGGAVDWEDHYRKIGNELRPLLGRQSQPAPAAQQAAGNPSQAPDKEARKASIVNLPTAAARAELPKEEKELSPEEERRRAIAEMRKSRGLTG